MFMVSLQQLITQILEDKNVTCVALTETSDATLKENIKEVNTKECYKAVKYVN